MTKYTSKISIKLNDRYSLVAEQSTDPEYQNEIYIGVVDDKDSAWIQDLAIIKSKDSSKFDNEFTVHLYTDELCEDCTHTFDIKLHEWDD